MAELYPEVTKDYPGVRLDGARRGVPASVGRPDLGSVVPGVGHRGELQIAPEAPRVVDQLKVSEAQEDSRALQEAMDSN